MLTDSHAPRNKTIRISDAEQARLEEALTSAEAVAEDCAAPLDSIICGDSLDVLRKIAPNSVNLVIADPPYNRDKTFNEYQSSLMNAGSYADWSQQWLAELHRILKPNGTLYVCSDWQSSSAVQAACEEYFIIQNRITWEREKGRGALRNWKNASEDIWFCTKSKDYTFNIEDVKLRRKVIAPYRDADGAPKDWNETASGNTRLTHPSNLWTDLTVPFWSMAENTEHPTQKPEKLIAKLILASSNEGDVVLDPFLGSGTTVVTATKLSRHFIGIEIDRYYCALALKRLEIANHDASIQGYSGGVFWERNSGAEQQLVNKIRAREPIDRNHRQEVLI